MKTSIDIIDLLKKIYQKNEKLQEVVGETDILDTIMDDLEDVIMTQFGIPEMSPDASFCRDYWSEFMYNFLSGILSKKDLIKELRSWKSIIKKEKKK